MDKYSKINKEYDKIDNFIDNLIGLFIDGIIDKQIYLERSGQCDREIEGQIN